MKAKVKKSIITKARQPDRDVVMQEIIAVFELGKQAGMKVVVDWVDTHKLYAGNISIPKSTWQSKLKEWGIE